MRWSSNGIAYEGTLEEALAFHRASRDVEPLPVETEPVEDEPTATIVRPPMLVVATPEASEVEDRRRPFPYPSHLPIARVFAVLTDTPMIPAQIAARTQLIPMQAVELLCRLSNQGWAVRDAPIRVRGQVHTPWIRGDGTPPRGLTPLPTSVRETTRSTRSRAKGTAYEVARPVILDALSCGHWMTVASLRNEANLPEYAVRNALRQMDDVLESRKHGTPPVLQYRRRDAKKVVRA